MLDNTYIYTLCAGVYRVRRVGHLQLGIHRDPGQGPGQRLAAGGRPALGKTYCQGRGTGPWKVHGNR